MTWNAFDHGSTIGSVGTEEGTIVCDDELPGRSRITLEVGGAVAPWAITWGLYGITFSTRWFPNEEQARREYEVMKDALGDMAWQLDEADLGTIGHLVETFMSEFP